MGGWLDGLWEGGLGDGERGARAWMENGGRGGGGGLRIASRP